MKRTVKKTPFKTHTQTSAKTIAENTGIQIDSRQYYDPIHQSWMLGDFLRKLSSSRKAHIKLFVSSMFCLFPVLLWFSYAASSGELSSPSFLIQIPLFLLYLGIGLKLMLSGIQDLKKR